jgi:ADP-ribosyl-[dinitrogen reductase] hydrolase
LEEDPVVTRYTRALDTAYAAAQEVARLVLAEFSAPGGLRGHGDHAPIDDEIEALLRDAVESVDPAWGVLGEELTARNRPCRDPEHHIWLIDPQDGTSAALRGYRGSAVSVGLLRDGVPVLGVVVSCTTGDSFRWAEGEPFLRNGRPVHRPPWPEALSANHTIFVSQSADRQTGGSEANIDLCAPARPRSMASIAHRLALVAAGDAAVGVSLAGAGAWDYCAGDALLRAVGGELVDHTGARVAYARDGRSGTRNCFGGAPGVVQALSRRNWDDVLRRAKAGHEATPPPNAWFPAPLPARPAPATFDRGAGCFLGQLAGDSLGSLVEFQDARTIAARYPGGVRELADGGTFNTIAGQATDDSELALVLARSLVECGGFDVEDVARRYAGWFDSRPFDMGRTTATALSAASRAMAAGQPVAAAAAEAAGRGSAQSQANGALMRISPLAIAGAQMDESALAAAVRADAALTHPHEVCGDANAVFAVTIARAIRDPDLSPQALYDGALAYAQDRAPSVAAAVEAAQQGPPEEFMHQMGWVLIALRNAFHQLLTAPTVEEGVSRTVGFGGDTDTNAAIAGALLGAAHGRSAVPAQWQDRVLTCRPLDGAAGVHRPRPRRFWPFDALDLTERLLMLLLVAVVLGACVPNDPVDFYDRDLAVVDVHPRPDLGEIPTNARITVTFSNYVDPGPLNYFNALSLDSGGIRASDRAVYRLVGKKATVITRRSLEPGIYYDLGMNPEVLRSVTGRPYGGPGTIRFQVGTFSVTHPPTAPSPTWEQVEPLFAPCGECHDDPEWMLPPMTREGLIGEPSAHDADLWLVRPGDSARSYLMHKILWDYPVREGTAQPPPWAGKTQLSIEAQDTIERWILGGAL